MFVPESSNTPRLSLVRRLLAALAIVALVCSGFYLWFDSNRQRHPLRVGFSQFPPYVIDTGSSEPQGLAVEMIKRSARIGKIPIRWVRITDIDEGLNTKAIDVFPLGTLTDQRRKDLHVSEPWWENEVALISLDARPLKTAPETAGKLIAVRQLYTVEQLAERLFPKARLTLLLMEEMPGALCRGEVDGFFLDLRLLQAQLLRGSSVCNGKGLHVASIPNGGISLGTLALPEVSRTADRLFEGIAQLSADGTLSELASRWSLYNAFQSRHIKEALEAQHRAEFMRFGLAGLALILMLVSFQTHRLRRARMVAEESNQRFDAFMRYMPAIAFMKDSDGRMAFVNELFCKTFNKTREQTIGKSDRDLFTPELAAQFRQNDLRVLSQNRAEEILETALDANGEARHFLSYKFPFTHPSGDKFLGGVAVDITERLRAEEALKLSQFSIDCSQDTMVWIDHRGIIFNANQAACENLGYAKTELIGLHVSAIDPSVDRDNFPRSREQLKQAGSLTVESFHRRKDGATYPVEIHQNFLAFQGAEYSCCMCRDITERKQAEQELARQARHDALTGLPNRRLLETRLTQVIEAARPQEDPVAVIYLDLDGFKLVNDTLGHSVGDQLLQQVATRLAESLRPGDMLFRMGGDEFTAVLTGVADQKTTAEIAQRLLERLQENFSVEDHDLLVTASIGISLFPRDGSGESDLLRKADAAMYESKRQGKNKIQFFTPEMGQVARERLDLENHLRRALDRDEFSLVFQPEFCLDTGKILRHEALLRWTHPTLGSVPPSKFIPVAEETTMIVPIGRWVLDQACRLAREWQITGSEGVGVAVNVSLVQFARPDFIETIEDVLIATGLPSHLLELELTESVVMHSLLEAKDKILRLRQLGVTVSIDDFGTGYSSLSYLQQLPIDSLKIDRSFIENIALDANSVSLTGAMVSIAHSLGMKVVVEGIESSGQLAAIRRLGCEVGQGFYLGLPSSTPLQLDQSVAA